MANRNHRQGGGRRMEYGRGPQRGVSPWQAGGPAGVGTPQALLPLAGASPEATLALANNLINNLLHSRTNAVPSLLDMPLRHDMPRQFDHYPPRMGNQGNYRRTTGTYNRAGERVNTNRKIFKPNDGPRNKQPLSKKENNDSRPRPVKSESNESGDKEGENKEGAGDGKGSDGNKSAENRDNTPKTPYDDIDPALLQCHICNKSMWDGRSFQNHINGRAHSIMMEKAAQSYELIADTMRQEFKISEVKRTRKSGHSGPRDFYCAMCHLYAADGPLHRTTVGHRKLKKYLHPSCTSCHKEMATRVELDEHRLTPQHLRSLHDKRKDTAHKPKPEVMVISTLEMEQSYVRLDGKRNVQASRSQDKGEAGPSTTPKKEAGAEGDEAEDKAEEAPPDAEGVLLDFQEGDDVASITPETIPVYRTDRGVGRGFLTPFACVQCRLCHKLFDSEEAAEVHLRTWRHHQLFAKLLQDKSKPQSGENKRAANPSENDDSGNWKRRKTTTDADAANGDGQIKEEEESEEEAVEEEKPKEADEPELGEAEEALDSWEQDVDEILKDENALPDEQPVEEEKPTDVDEEMPEEKAKIPDVVESPSKRGRGRGRGRRRM